VNPIVAVVDRVIDGDTVWLRVRTRTRGSAPELTQQAGLRAKERLQKELPKGTEVEVRVAYVDNYGRPVANLNPLPRRKR